MERIPGLKAFEERRRIDNVPRGTYRIFLNDRLIADQVPRENLTSYYFEEIVTAEESERRFKANGERLKALAQSQKTRGPDPQ